MIFFHYSFWFMVGIGMAFLFFTFQHWSVQRIDPQNNQKSNVLILGGATLRWGLVFLTFVWAIKNSYMALFLVFFSFMLVRLYFLVKWNNKLSIDQEKIN